MAASNFTDLYNYGSYGYMGIGPMPAYSFTLTITANGDTFWLGNCTSTHIVAYNPTNTSQYAVYSGESFTVYSSGSSRMLVTARTATYPGVPTSQTITVSNKASDWDFHGLASLEGAALCIATNASGSSPDGHDYGSISSSQKLWFSYEKIVVLMADKINGCDIYAKRAEQDKDGNDIVSVPSSTSADENKVLTVNSSGEPEWAAAQGGSDVFIADSTSTNEDVYQAYLAGKVLFYKDASNRMYNVTRTSESTSAGYLNTVFNGYRAGNVNAGNFANVTVFSVTIKSQNGHADSSLFSSSISNKSLLVMDMPLLSGNAGKVLTVNSGASAAVWANAPTELPTVTGNAGKVLTVNSGATGTEWTNFTQIEVVASMPASPTSGVLYIVTGS